MLMKLTADRILIEFSKLLQLFANCETIDATHCALCKSGQAECPSDSTCWVSGRCLGNVSHNAGDDAIEKCDSFLSSAFFLFRSAFLNPNYSATRFLPPPGSGRKAILYGSLLGQFYLPPSNKKGLKVFKNVNIWVDVIFFYKISYTLTILAHFVFLGKSSTTR